MYPAFPNICGRAQPNCDRASTLSSLIAGIRLQFYFRAAVAQCSSIGSGREKRRRSAGLASSSRTPPGPRRRACAAAGQQATPRNAGARGLRSGLCSGAGSCFKPPFKELQRGSDICCCLLRGLCTHSAAGRQCPRTASAQKGHMQRRMQPRLRGNAPGQQALRSGPCGGW